jgi:hypothetical protein
MAFIFAIHITPDTSISKYLPLPSGTENTHWGIDPVNREGVPAVICLLAKNSLTDCSSASSSGTIFAHTFLVMIFS